MTNSLHPPLTEAARSHDGRAAICRRCAHLTHQSAKPSLGNLIRAAIKEGDISKVRGLISRSRFSSDRMLAMAVQYYNMARKPDGHGKIVDLLISEGAMPINMWTEHLDKAGG